MNSRNYLSCSRISSSLAYILIAGTYLLKPGGKLFFILILSGAVLGIWSFVAFTRDLLRGKCKKGAEKHLLIFYWFFNLLTVVLAILIIFWHE